MIIYNETGQPIGEIWESHTKPPEPTTGKRIALVVGHDNHSKGAYGSEGIAEWDFNKELLTDLKSGGYLPSQHEYFVFYRNSSMNGYTAKMVDLHERIDAVNADISIEFHFNGTGDSSVNGNEVLYCSSNGKELASKLDEALDSLPNRDRGIKKVAMNENGGGFCCRGKSVAIIAEPFFGSHQSQFISSGKDRQLLKQCYKNFFNSL